MAVALLKQLKMLHSRVVSFLYYIIGHVAFRWFFSHIIRLYYMSPTLLSTFFFLAMNVEHIMETHNNFKVSRPA